MAELTPREVQELEVELRAALGPHDKRCPPVDVLLAVGQDVLPAEIEVAAARHLAECRLCSGLLGDLATLPESELTPDAEKRIAAALPIKHSGKARVLVAVAALLLFGLVGVLSWRGLQRPKELAVVPPVGHSAPAVALLEIPLTPLAPPLDGVALATRGVAGAEPATEQLMPAFTAYNRADYATAATRFESLAARYPKSEIVPLYLGVSELCVRRDQDAETSLRRARAASRSPKMLDAEKWYGAIAAARLHKPEAATLLGELCREKQSAYSLDSCRLLARTEP